MICCDTVWSDVSICALIQEDSVDGNAGPATTDDQDGQKIDGFCMSTLVSKVLDLHAWCTLRFIPFSKAKVQYLITFINTVLAKSVSA